jgi:hypothetical protein
MNPWRNRLAFLLIVTLGVLPSVAFGDNPARRVPNIDDLLGLKSIGTAQIAPDGKWVAYTVTPCH